MPWRPGTARATLATVAASAGVSVATVSKVLNGRSDVAPATRALVQELLQQHDYVGRRAADAGRGVADRRGDLRRRRSTPTRPRSSQGVIDGRRPSSASRSWSASRRAAAPAADRPRPGPRAGHRRPAGRDRGRPAS